MAGSIIRGVYRVPFGVSYGGFILWSVNSVTHKDLKVEMWPIERLIPYARNPRKNDAQVDRMCGVIKEFGFRIPVVAKSDGSVVDGHLRLKAAQRLGLLQVPVAIADELTDAQVKAFRLLANKSANWAEWDYDLLKLEIQDIEDLKFDVSMTGFDVGELTQIFFEPDFAPGTEADQGKLDELQPKMIPCPHCGQEFDLREHERRIKS